MKTRTITISKSDILFDVAAETHIFSTTITNKDLFRADALEADSGDASLASTITRFADRRNAEIREIISRFLTSETATAASGTISSAASYVYSLYVEDEFRDELLSSIASDIEAYIANGAIADWYIAAGDQQGSIYLQRLAPTAERIVQSIVKRKIPSRS